MSWRNIHQPFHQHCCGLSLWFCTSDQATVLRCQIFLWPQHFCRLKKSQINHSYEEPGSDLKSMVSEGFCTAGKKWVTWRKWRTSWTVEHRRRQTQRPVVFRTRHECQPNKQTIPRWKDSVLPATDAKRWKCDSITSQCQSLWPARRILPTSKL